MYCLEDYADEKIAVVVSCPQEYRWLAARCIELDYKTCYPGWYPASLSGWGTFGDPGYYKEKYNIPEISLCELREYIDEDSTGCNFDEEEFLSLIGG